jgi:hypothetical protein
VGHEEQGVANWSQGWGGVDVGFRLYSGKPQTIMCLLLCENLKSHELLDAVGQSLQ